MFLEFPPRMPNKSSSTCRQGVENKKKNIIIPLHFNLTGVTRKQQEFLEALVTQGSRRQHTAHRTTHLMGPKSLYPISLAFEIISFKFNTCNVHKTREDWRGFNTAYLTNTARAHFLQPHSGRLQAQMVLLERQLT